MLPSNGIDPCGSCLHWLWFWKDCDLCSKLTSEEKTYVNVVHTLAKAKEVAGEISSTLKNVYNKAQKTGKSAIRNIEASAGIGLGLEGSLDVVDGFSVGFGASLDMLNISLVDGKFQLQQRFSQGASVSLFFIDLVEQEEQYYEFANYSKPDVHTQRDAINIVGGKVYFIAGGSFYIGFDFLSFFKDLNEIY